MTEADDIMDDPWRTYLLRSTATRGYKRDNEGMYKCDWPHCTAKCEPWASAADEDRSKWAACDNSGLVPFLPDDCFLCPEHADMFDQIACDPNLLTRDDEDEFTEEEVK